jgi:hypothetical protein
VQVCYANEAFLFLVTPHMGREWMPHLSLGWSLRVIAMSAANYMLLVRTSQDTLASFPAHDCAL